jgi:hypothetical protein
MDSTTLFDNSPAAKKLGKAALSRWKLETLTGLLGINALQQHQSESHKNQQAENQHVRKSVWGSEVASQSDDDDMRNIVLGDVNHPTPVVIAPQQQSNGLLPLAIAAALLAPPVMGVAGLAAGYYMLQKPEATAPIAQEFEDGSIKIGLGRIEDYIKEESK